MRALACLEAPPRTRMPAPAGSAEGEGSRFATATELGLGEAAGVDPASMALVGLADADKPLIPRLRHNHDADAGGRIRPMLRRAPTQSLATTRRRASEAHSEWATGRAAG